MVLIKLSWGNYASFWWILSNKSAILSLSYTLRDKDSRFQHLSHIYGRIVGFECHN